MRKLKSPLAHGGSADARESAKALLTRDQQVKVLTSPGFVVYAKIQLQNLDQNTQLLQNMAPRIMSGSGPTSLPPSGFSQPSGYPSNAPTGSWPTAPSSDSRASSSLSQPGVPMSSGS